MLADAAVLPTPLLGFVRIGVPLSAILISAGLFFSVLPPTATQASGAVALIYVGAAGTGLRHRKFFSLRELNLAIRELLEKLNQRPFQKREGWRWSLFLEVDQPALRPLPAERFDLSEWSQATVNITYVPL